VRSQDANQLLAALVANPDTRRVAWPLVKARWDEVQKKGAAFTGNVVIVQALAAFCDAGSVKDVQSFFAAHKVPEAERTLQQSIERITSCAALAARERPGLARWLQAPAQ
jgi:aminopeptidase N